MRRRRLRGRGQRAGGPHGDHHAGREGDGRREDGRRHVDVRPRHPHRAERTIVDVNGAGDAFVGGFLAATAAGKDVETACRVGNWAAGEVIQFSGCTFDKARKCPLM